MADDRDRFERSLAGLVLTEEPVGKLLTLADHAAAVFLRDGSYALVFRLLPGGERSLGEHLLRVASEWTRGRLFLVLVGGDDEEHERMLQGAQVGARVGRRVGVMQVKDGGRLWVGPRTSSEHPLAAALQHFVERDEAAAGTGVRRRLEAAVEPNADGSQDAAAFARRLLGARPWASYSLVALCAAMFLLSNLWGSSTYVPTLVRLGANVPMLIQDGQLQRLGSSVFLHAGWTHLLMNAFGVIILGGFIERLLGSGRLLILFGLSGVVGSAASALFSSGALSVGASGALWGLFGASAMLAFVPIVPIPQVLLAQLRRNTLMVLGINLLISFLPRIDLFAHLGGGLTGALVVFSRLLTRGTDVGRPDAPEARRRSSLWLSVVAGLVATVMLASTVHAVFAGRAWELTQRPVWQRVELGDSGVSFELPGLIVQTSDEVSAGARREYAFGHPLADPLTVWITVGPASADIAQPERFEAVFLELQGELESLVPKAAARRGKIQRRSFADVPTLEELFVYPSRARHWRWSQLRQGRTIHVQALIWPDGSDFWDTELDRLLSSMRSARP